MTRLALQLVEGLGPFACSGDTETVAPGDTDDTTSGTQTDTDTGTEDTDTEDTGDTGPPPPEPMPAFTASGTFEGAIAIDADGIRTYTFQGTEYYSVIQMWLTAEDEQDSCMVALDPSFAGFSIASPSNRYFPTVLIELGQSTILQDDCGWDDTHILTELASRDRGGIVEVGLAAARFPEDGPLDVYYDRSWPLPGSTANIVRSGAGVGWAMDSDGLVEGTQQVFPVGSSFLPGLYEF
jgi:hypothetical protein